MPTPSKVQVGDRVRVRHGPEWGGETAYGTVISENLGTGYRRIRVALDGRSGSISLHPSSAEALTPLEQLAAEARKNPKRHRVPIQTRIRHIRGVKGTIIDVSKSRGDPRIWHKVILDDSERICYLLRDEFEILSEIELLAEVKSNPKRDLEVGDLVHVRVTLHREEIGVVVMRVGLHAVWVKLDSGSEIFRGIDEITELTPIEMLARLGKEHKAKNNPKGKGMFEVGDRVRIWCGRGKSEHVGEVGTVIGKPDWQKDKHYVHKIKLDNSHIGDVLVDAFELERVSPVEELALLGKKAKKNPVSRAFEVGDRVYVMETGQRPHRGSVTDFPSMTHPTWPEVKLDADGSTFIVHPRMLQKLSDLELLAESKVRKNPKLSYADAKKQILTSLAGLPHSQRIDGKCLLANTTLCGLAGGRLAIGIATHKQYGPVQHIWVVDGQGQVQDALSAWYSGHREDPAQARVLGEAWLAAPGVVQDVAGGMDVIAFWRRHRGV